MPDLTVADTVEGNFTEYKVLEQLRQSFFTIAGEKLEELKQTDFMALRKNYPTTGNVINFVVELLEIYTHNFGDFLERESSLRESLRTAIIEHPLADAVGEYTFTNQWVLHEGRLRLGTSGGFLDEIIARSIDDKTGQVPEFEIERNKMDARIIAILTNLRNAGSNETVVKFSPSPVNIHDPEVRARGYQGNDQICLFELTPEGEEKQTIYWFPYLTRADYISLAYGLVAVDPLHPSSKYLESLMKNLVDQPLDLEVMAFSCNFSQQQIELIKQFIRENQNQSNINREVIENYANTVIRSLVDTNLISEVYLAAISMLEGKDAPVLYKFFNEIFNLIEQAQFDFRLFNRDHGGKNTFDNSTSMKLIDYSWDVFQSMNREERYLLQRTSGFSATGCGFSADLKKVNSGQFLWGPMPLRGESLGVDFLYPKDFGDPHYGVCGKGADSGCGRYTIVGGCELCVECHNRY